jgi:hypothetical protein
MNREYIMKEKYEDKRVWLSVAVMDGTRCDSGGTD